MKLRKWDRHWLQMARQTSLLSKDPSTKVGAVAVRDRTLLSTGYNGFPRGFADTEERLLDRGLKLKYVVHAEENCVYNAGRIGSKLEGADLYVFGLPVCCGCARGVVQAGVVRVIQCHEFPVADRWLASCVDAKALMTECKIEQVHVNVRELDE
jgi:dCMP deaminase